MSESHQAAAEAVMRYADERNGHHPGCYVLSGFIPTERLLAFARDFEPDAALRGKPLSEAVGQHLQASGGMVLVAEGLVGFIAADSQHPDRPMAARILDQVRSDAATRETYRRPVHYVAAHEEGLAIAVAIDDRFWTEDW